VNACHPFATGRGWLIENRDSSQWLPVRSSGFIVRDEVRPDVGAAIAAGLADEQGLDIGQADLVGPSAGVNRCRVAALEVRAVDQDAVNAHLAHLAEGDFLGAALHDERSQSGFRY
jgi:hypothetical protein